MRSRLPIVWSSRWSVKVAAFSTLVSFSKEILRHKKVQTFSGGSKNPRHVAQQPQRKPIAQTRDAHFGTPSGTTNFS